jgi:hypothetical protein
MAVLSVRSDAGEITPGDGAGGATTGLGAGGITAGVTGAGVTAGAGGGGVRAGAGADGVDGLGAGVIMNTEPGASLLVTEGTDGAAGSEEGLSALATVIVPGLDES